MKKKGLILLLALTLLVGCIIGSTGAWLSDKTDPVVNTFTTSGIDITLNETTGQDYKMIPGLTVDKDPVVTVLKGSETCYLFVKLDESNNFGSYLEYDVADGWTRGDGIDIPSNVYYRIVDGSGSDDQSFPVIKDNTVSVKSTVTGDMMKNLTENTYPILTVTAYASQLAKTNSTLFTEAEAWAIIAPSP